MEQYGTRWKLVEASTHVWNQAEYSGRKQEFGDVLWSQWVTVVTLGMYTELIYLLMIVTMNLLQLSTSPYCRTWCTQLSNSSSGSPTGGHWYNTQHDEVCHCQLGLFFLPTLFPQQLVDCVTQGICRPAWGFAMRCLSFHTICSCFGSDTQADTWHWLAQPGNLVTLDDTLVAYVITISQRLHWNTFPCVFMSEWSECSWSHCLLAAGQWSQSQWSHIFRLGLEVGAGVQTDVLFWLCTPQSWH